MNKSLIALLAVGLPIVAYAQDSGLPQTLEEATGQAHCPLCVAGGYGVGSNDTRYRWLYNTVYAPSTETEAETFLWYRVDNRLSLGVGHLWKQNALRFLGTYQLAPEKNGLPSLHMMAGVQGIGEGNPGVSVTAEKNFPVLGGSLNVFTGVGYRTNREITRFVGGAKYALASGWTFGYQNDGLRDYPFATYTQGLYTVGAYLIEFKSPAVLVGTRF